MLIKTDEMSVVKFLSVQIFSLFSSGPELFLSLPFSFLQVWDRC